MKTALQILLTIAILALGYWTWESLQQPIRFQKAMGERRTKVIERLTQIRDAQVAYRSVNGKYTASFDTLISFVKTAQLPLVRMEGRLTDSMYAAGMTEVEALKIGIIKRDTVMVSVIDSLVKGKYVPDSLAVVPFTNGEKFTMGVGAKTTASGLVVQLFEAKVPNKVYLNGLDEQEVKNLDAAAFKLERFPGLQVGSLEDANNNAGNWE
ncbi:MAG: hypothetical protein JXR39_06150 [Marinilabiliaceae bacterium]|nr:hypothetical protein [Marinilabiliaceae bacterium]